MVQIPQKARQWYLPKREGVESLTVRTVEVPKPTANQVLVKIHAASLNYRDIIIAKDQYLGYGGVLPNVVPASDGAGEVVAVGPDVKRWAVGDRVAANFSLDYVGVGVRAEYLGSTLGGPIDGVLSEYKTFPDYGLVKLPENLSYEEASTLPCAAVTAWNALHGPVPVKAGDTVLVLGTGGVSIFALQFAVASGAIVIATSSSNEKLAKAKELGATHLINYKENPDWDQEVLKLTKGAGADHVVEVGGPGTILKSLTAVSMDGWVHIIGFLGAAAPNDQALFTAILGKHVSIRRIMVGPRTMFEELNRAVEAKKIKPVVDSVFAFDEAVAAFKHLEAQKHIGKVVIRVAN